MRTGLAICLLISAMFSTMCSTVWSQAAPAAKAAPAKKPAAAVAARPASAPAAGPTAIIDTTAGKLTCTLFPDKAPIGVANFIGLAQGTKDWTNPVSHAKKHGVPLYDGTIFHRVIPEFMIQGGDPAGTGSGEIGFEFKNETSPTLKFDRPGRLAYANAGPDTNGSQFFITEVPYPQPEWRIHHLRPMRRGHRRSGKTDCTHGPRRQRPALSPGEDQPHHNRKGRSSTGSKRPPATAAKPAVKKPAAPATAPK